MLIKTLFEEHKLARRLTLFWSMAMATTAILWGISSPKDASQIAGVLVAAIGLPGVITGFYIAHRAQGKG